MSYNNLGNEGHSGVLQVAYDCKIFSNESWQSYLSVLMISPKENNVWAL